MTSTKDVKREIAILSVVAVKESPFLIPVNGVVGGVEIQNDLIGGAEMAVEKNINKELVDRFAGHGDFLVSTLGRRTWFR